MTTGTVKKKAKRKRKATPSAPARPRVAKFIPPLSQPEALGTFAGKLVAQGEGNPGMFVNPPNLAALKAANAALALAVVAAEGGTDAAQTALLAGAVKVHDIIVQHAAWIQAEANELAPADATNYITTAAFQIAKKGQRTKLTAPELTNAGAGVIHFALPPTEGALMWFTELSLDGGKTFTRSVDTEHLKGDITGLPSGQTVNVRIRPYVRGSGYAPWTTLTIMVT